MKELYDKLSKIVIHDDIQMPLLDVAKLATAEYIKSQGRPYKMITRPNYCLQGTMSQCGVHHHHDTQKGCGYYDPHTFAKRCSHCCTEYLDGHCDNPVAQRNVGKDVEVSRAYTNSDIIKVFEQVLYEQRMRKCHEDDGEEEISL